MTDEIRCHVSLSPMFLGETLLRPNGYSGTCDRRAFFIASRSWWLTASLSTPDKEKNALRAGQGAFTVAPEATGFLSSATDERPFVGATVSQPNSSSKGIRRVKESEAMFKIQQGGSMTQDTLNQLVQDRYREAIKTHKTPNIQLLELKARMEVLERGETIEAMAE